VFFNCAHTATNSIPPCAILPLSHSNLYQNDRTDLLFSTVPLPPTHCHSPCHRDPIYPLHHYIAFLKKISKKKKYTFFNRLYQTQYCYCHTLLYTKMTAPIPSIQRYHCHPTTATLHATVTPYFIHYFFFFKTSQYFHTFFNRSQLCQYCHCHTLPGTIRTALIPSIQRYHCHPTTATPHATVTPYIHYITILLFFS
jgi:hypothetical protein